MDQFDQATELETQDRELALSRARNCADGPQATGRCLWCDSPLADGHRWCNATCRDDWQYTFGRRK